MTVQRQEGQEVVHLVGSIQNQKEISIPTLTNPEVDLETEASLRPITEGKGVHQSPKPQHPEEIHHHQERGRYQEADHLVNKAVTLLNPEKVDHQRDILLYQ